MIIEGKIAPGTILTQGSVAKALNVSRTPVREAIRIVQEQGLLHAEPNFRARVIGFDAEAIEALYCKRVLLETLGVAASIPLTTDEELADIRQSLDRLCSDEVRNDFTAFLAANREFHRLLVRHSGPTLQKEIQDWSERSEIYISLYEAYNGDSWWVGPQVDHVELVAAYGARRLTVATSLIARHLAHTAFTLLQEFAPDYQPTRLRVALRVALMAGGAAEDESAVSGQPKGRATNTK